MGLLFGRVNHQFGLGVEMQVGAELLRDLDCRIRVQFRRCVDGRDEAHRAAGKHERMRLGFARQQRQLALIDGDAVYHLLEVDGGELAAHHILDAVQYQRADARRKQIGVAVHKRLRRINGGAAEPKRFTPYATHLVAFQVDQHTRMLALELSRQLGLQLQRVAGLRLRQSKRACHKQ
jgi:hypothetical protein